VTSASLVVDTVEPISEPDIGDFVFEVVVRSPGDLTPCLLERVGDCVGTLSPLFVRFELLGRRWWPDVGFSKGDLGGLGMPSPVLRDRVYTGSTLGAYHIRYGWPESLHSINAWAKCELWRMFVVEDDLCAKSRR